MLGTIATFFAITLASWIMKKVFDRGWKQITDWWARGTPKRKQKRIEKIEAEITALEALNDDVIRADYARSVIFQMALIAALLSLFAVSQSYEVLVAIGKNPTANPPTLFAGLVPGDYAPFVYSITEYVLVFFVSLVLAILVRHYEPVYPWMRQKLLDQAQARLAKLRG